eukprot:TRINITY_DN1734_c0_g1_i6.p1 TRINITY_DN1734_c0_g1~~TRINITY_DN1734_c0_g1_i6.p1  ORF type:complete len:254 (-),score=57.38 TRINITY_DN1734_c0_g1_i6:94-855(-)
MKASQVFDKMTDVIQELGIGSDRWSEDGKEEVGYDDDEVPDFEEKDEDQVVEKKVVDAVDQEVAALKFAHATSDAATLRLIQDLKALKRSQSKSGFSAEPMKVNGKANLYHWEIKLFDFEGPLAKDIIQYKKQTGKDYIVIHLRFSSEYPYKPPFVRVVEPVFQFRTGHVTMGGAICMELLTLTGWKPFNDIEQIIIQIRAEIGSLEGGARLDLNQNAAAAYNENEAWSAFYRAASTHGWNVTGLNAQMFPKI